MRQRIERILEALGAGLVERDEAMRLALLAVLAGEHVLFLGPPGTAKSEIARRLLGAFGGGAFFERLLTRFTVPEELFGPLSLRALEADAYVRVTAGYLPTASIAFLDEIFKANSTILNTLLGILNERRFENGAERVELPLLAVVAASNELPEGDELRALLDRFLVRHEVAPVSPAGMRALLAAKDFAPRPVADEDRFTPAEIRELQASAANISVSPGVVHVFSALREWATANEIFVSDRRWLKAMKLLRVAARTVDRDVVVLWDAWLLTAVVGDTPVQRRAVEGWLGGHLFDYVKLEPARYARMAQSFEGWIEQRGSGQRARRDEQGRPLYMGDDGAPTPVSTAHKPIKGTDGEPLFKHPARASTGHTVAELWRDHFSATNSIDALELYIKKSENLFWGDTPREPLFEPDPDFRRLASGQLANVEKALVDLDRYGAVLEDQLARFDPPPWVPPEPMRALVQALESSRSTLSSARDKLVGARDRLRASVSQSAPDSESP
ncbi:MAG: AAA family ATPase [Polyangiaceae bacterium]